MASQTILKASGLNTQPNQLNVPDGSLALATNVIIKSDNIVESRRGFNLYGQTFGSSSTVAKQLMEYKLRLIRHFDTTLQYDTEVLDSSGNSIFNSFSGSYTEPSPGLKIKSIESNGNLYFTTNAGVKRISALTANDFTTAPGFIQNSGGLKALNISTALDVTLGGSTGFLPEDSTVAYRVVWGLTDLNNDQILGTPSQRAVVYNSLQQMLVRDFDRLLVALDNLNQPGSFITAGNYTSTYKLPLTASGSQLYTNMIAVATAIDTGLGTLAATANISSATISSGICTVTFSTIQPQTIFRVGDFIYLSGFNPATGTLNGVQQVLNVTSTTITFSTTATGTVTLSSQAIQAGKFRAISLPTAPSNPTTNAQLVSLQNYLSNIEIGLQLTDNQYIAANGTGVSAPLKVNTGSPGSVSGGTATLNFSTGTATQVFKVGDVIFLSGYSITSGSINGLQTVTAVASGTVSFATAATGTITTTTPEIDKIIWFTNTLQSQFLFPISITTSANVDINIVVPPNTTTSYFYQIYRSSITQAATTDVLANLVPNDEMRLVYESFPTQAQINAGNFTVVDITPDSFVQGSTFLYTNEVSGQGILQANDIPPLCTDINKFKNVVFYSNTQTKQRLNLDLLGLSKIQADYNGSLSPKLSIVTPTTYNEYKFVKGAVQVTTIVVSGTLATSGPGSYFLINNANNKKQYYVWYQDGTSVDPAVSGAVAVPVYILSGDTLTTIATKTANALSALVDDFSVSQATTTLTITNINEGLTNSPSPGTTTFTTSVSSSGAGEKIAQNVVSITCVAGSSLTSSGTADYFTLNTPFDHQLYYFWYQVGTSGSPALNGRTGIQIAVLGSDTAAQVAAKTNTAINNLLGFFTSSVLSNVLTVTTNAIGETTPATNHVANGGFAISTTQAGAADVLLSNLISPSSAVQATSLSLINVINNNTSEVVSGYYLSGPNDVPGLMLLEAKSLATVPFYVQTNQSGTGNSFNPVIAPTFTSVSNTAANPTVVTINNHGFKDGDQVLLSGTSSFTGSGSQSFPSINGIYTISQTTTNTFSIVVNEITAGTIGAATKLPFVNSSNNESKPNRIYYSKYLQPDAVPLENTIDVGAADKAILRIFPLRDSLFVFKEDGLYRISGETAPFNLALFDSSCILIAADSLALCNNVLYGWTRQGISQITEFGVQTISRPIDTTILPLANSLYTNFKQITWGIGYESDNSYTVFTVKNTTDTVPQIAYRYSNLTNSWTVINKVNSCGVRKSTDDKLYLGAGDTNSLEAERKNFDRTDYADRQYVNTLALNGYLNNGTTLKLNSVANISVGDVVTQDQNVSIYQFNALLQKLDIDPNVGKPYAVSTAPGSVSWSNNVATVTFTTNISGFVAVGDSMVISGIDPIGYNGIFKILSITNGGTTVTYNLFSNPGTYNLSGGTGTYSYLTSLQALPGDNLRTDLANLAAKLDLDPGITTHVYSSSIASHLQTSVPNTATNPTVITFTNHGLKNNRIINITASTSVPNINGIYAVTDIDANTFSVPQSVLTAGTLTYETQVNNFADIQACFNIIVGLLNSDAGTAFKNYSPITFITTQEAIVTAVNTFTNTININVALPFLAGSITNFKSIPTSFQYTPISTGDALNLKHFRESTMIFLTQTFTNATVSYSSDLLPAFIDIPIIGQGNGIFGSNSFGQNFFGGLGNSQPFRTLVPRDCQRCRFLNIRYSHQIAREKWQILGTSVTGKVVSTRAYR